MRKSGSTVLLRGWVLLLLGYANNVDAMTRVRRGGTWMDNFGMDFFGTDSDGAEDSMTATTTADPFDDSFFNDSDDDNTFAASAIINVEADANVDAEGHAEADVEVGADGKAQMGARAVGGSLIPHYTTTTQRPGAISDHRVHTTRATTHTHTHAAHTCDNGGRWNHANQRCDCDAPYWGIWCNRVAHCPSCYQGTCKVTQVGDKGVAKCVCYDGWYLSDCRKSDCGGKGYSTVVDGQAKCICSSPYFGPLCGNTVVNDRCDLNCGANGNCMKDANGVEYCKCATNYYWNGSSCVLYTRPSCQNILCGQNQHCVMVGDSPQCRCNAGFFGPDCSQQTCNKKCGLNGTCVGGGSSSTCVCHNNYSGEYCTNPPRATCALVCNNGGYCKFSANGQQFCQCTAGWTGPNCSQRPPCTKNCGPNGNCVGFGNGSSSTCVCNIGYSGDRCDQRNCGLVCNNGGNCQFNTNGQQYCQCLAGWTGPNCSQRVQQCTKKCGPNGTCVGTGSSSTCQCRNGYTGEYCNIPPCDLNCGANGECKISNGVQYCECEDGYSGENCTPNTVDACNIDGRGTSPCQNNCQCNLKTPAQCEDCEYTCTNTNGNSFLGGKCQYNEPSLTCMTEMIQIQVDQDLIDDWEQNNLSSEWGANLFHGSKFDDSRCQYTRISSGNSDYAITISAADWTKCGGSVSVQNGMLTVSNKVSRDVTHSIISFEEPVFDWTCQYQIAVADGIVGPPPPRNPIQVVENHNFNINMKFYCDPREDVNRQQLQTMNGNAVIMTDQVYVNIDLNQLNQFQHLPTMGMRLGDCTAETGFGNNAEKFTIIRNGCPTSIGLTKIEYQTDREIEFKFNNFIDRRGLRHSTQVKISCQIRMCGQSCGAQPVCSSRRRRGIPEIDSELELLESDLFEDSEIFSLSESEEIEEISVKDIELFDTVLYMDIEDIIPMNSTKIAIEN